MAYIVQAMVTKFLGPTNYRGSRIKATAVAGSVTVNYDCRLGIEANHSAAAELLADKLGWGGVWFQGGLPGEGGYVFVSTGREDKAELDGDIAFITIQKQV